MRHGEVAAADAEHRVGDVCELASQLCREHLQGALLDHQEFRRTSEGCTKCGVVLGIGRHTPKKDDASRVLERVDIDGEEAWIRVAAVIHLTSKTRR